MAKKYRVRRTQPNEYAQNQATSLKECKWVLDGKYSTWKPLLNDKHTRAFGEVFRAERSRRKLTIYKDILDVDNHDEVVDTVVVDEYVIEEV